MKLRLSLRARIIILFSLITIILAGVMSQVSYYTVRAIYLDQLTDQVNLITRLIVGGLNTKFLPFLTVQDSKSAAHSYYKDYLQNRQTDLQLQDIFIFNTALETVLSSDSTETRGVLEPILLINRTEIERLAVGQSTTSLPFNTQDGHWYLWGFYRLDENHFLGVRESADRLAKVEDLSLVFVWIGMGGIILTIFSALFVSKTLAKPVYSLVEFSNLLGKGDWSTPVPKGIKGELSMLAQAMDGMRSDLLQRQKEKESMLAQIAHEIRNPLGGVELLAGLIKEDLNRDQKNISYAQKILDEITGLKSLINAYINYGRPATPEPEWVNIPYFVKDVKEIFKNELQEKNLRCEYEGSAALIWFDPHHFRQILINLIANAIHIMNPGGLIMIRSHIHGSRIMVEIIDEGPGVSGPNPERVFEPFYTTQAQGAGLGLAICKKLCTENSATIHLQNNGHKGCTFTITKKLNVSVY
ncbi:HAMP domain-containing histidine kinase [bacterium]|nr:HAMP domain-containing histidine kinase [bacterium]